jgi:head-tail adaptor
MEKTPYIGQMDRLVSIVSLVKTRNTTGEEETTDTVITSPWARMEDVSGNEDVEGKVRHLFNRKYTIRYNASVKQFGTGMVLIDSGERFNIYHIKELGRNRFLEILVENNE